MSMPVYSLRWGRLSQLVVARGRSVFTFLQWYRHWFVTRAPVSNLHPNLMQATQLNSGGSHTKITQKNRREAWEDKNPQWERDQDKKDEYSVYMHKTVKEFETNVCSHFHTHNLVVFLQVVLLFSAIHQFSFHILTWSLFSNIPSLILGPAHT